MNEMKEYSPKALAAARSYAESVVAEACEELQKQTGEEFTPSEDNVPLVMKYFLAGAGWQQDDIWNSVQVPPQKGREVVCISRDGHFFSSLFGMTGENWLTASSRAAVILWAYKEDIIPQVFNTIRE